MAHLSIPGKIFLLGEYAVLAGYPAWVATTAPRFELSVSRVGKNIKTPDLFHPQSPAGRLVSLAAESGVGLEGEWLDPYEGRGGFGASTAQFALVYHAFAETMGWDTSYSAVWRSYREMTQQVPSGADLVAQIYGGVLDFRISSEHSSGVSVYDLTTRFEWKNFLVFSCTEIPGRKVATHQHLQEVNWAEIDLEMLIRPLKKAHEAVQKSDVISFGQALNTYAGALSVLGFESPAAREDRLMIQKLPGVAGVKGAGALLSDVFIVLMKDVSQKQSVIELASARGLKLLTESLRPERGLKVLAGVEK